MALLLPTINSPADIKTMDIGQLRKLCSEIRKYMVECCSTNPGHLGSSLGAVELIVGMHYVFDTPKDNIIFDVSHQAYAHKILTGRRSEFRMNRCKNGISGFTCRDESPYDAFGAGHASTSISAAFGMAEAARITGSEAKTIAFIGDGALSGGLAFEGLNNAGGSNADLLVIVNDNNISIDRNIGAIHKHLLRLTTSPFYNTMKSRVWKLLGDGKFRASLQKQVIRLKSNLVHHSGGDLFELMGFRYFGPIDGNDIEAVVRTLQRIKDLGGPRVLHAITTKGKGYAPAEEDQTTWHAPGLFDPLTGHRIKIPARADRWQDVFGEVLLELARKDERIVGITPAMASGCGMNILAREMPDRFYDVGIAEEHAVTFSAGLAAGGLKPICNIYSSFAQRAYDQIIHDVALQRLPVVLCLDRAGLVGEDGATHQGVFDLAAYRSIPNCIIAAPRTEIDLKNLLYTASLHDEGPFIIRYPRGYAEGVQWRDVEFTRLSIGKGVQLKAGEKVAIVALGQFADRAMEAVEGLNVTVWDARFLKPFDKEILEDLRSGKYSAILTIEDGCIKGGLYSEICESLSPAACGIAIHPIGVKDEFVKQASQSAQREEYSLTFEKIRQKVLELSN